MFSDDLYYGCYACGKEAVNNTCYECGHDKYIMWLNEYGEHPNREQWAKHQAKNRKTTMLTKLYIKAEMLYDLVTLKLKLARLKRRMATIQKQITKVNNEWTKPPKS